MSKYRCCMCGEYKANERMTCCDECKEYALLGKALEYASEMSYLTAYMANGYDGWLIRVNDENLDLIEWYRQRKEGK